MLASDLHKLLVNVLLNTASDVLWVLMLEPFNFDSGDATEEQCEKQTIDCFLWASVCR